MTDIRTRSRNGGRLTGSPPAGSRDPHGIALPRPRSEGLWFVAAITRTSTLIDRSPPTRRNSPSVEHEAAAPASPGRYRQSRRETACHHALARRRRSVLVGAGEGTLDVTEQLALQQRLRDRGAIFGQEGFVLPWAVEVDRRATSSLPDHCSPWTSTVVSLLAFARAGRTRAASQETDPRCSRSLLARRQPPSDACLGFELRAPSRVFERERGMVCERFDESQILASEWPALTPAVQITVPMIFPRERSGTHINERIRTS